MDRILEPLAASWTPFSSPLLAFIITPLITEMTPGLNLALLAVLALPLIRIKVRFSRRRTIPPDPSLHAGHASSYAAKVAAIAAGWKLLRLMIAIITPA